MKKNTKIMAIKMMAQVVSTYHMFDALQHTGPLFIAAVGALGLGLGEYVISKEYAVMGDKNKLKKLMLSSLIGLSFISMLANIESSIRFIDWSDVFGWSAVYAAVSAGIYSVIWPAIIVTTSFIRLSEPATPAKNKAETEEEPPVQEQQPEPEKKPVNLRTYKKRSRAGYDSLPLEIRERVERRIAAAEAKLN
jgi:hypothetical protein